MLFSIETFTQSVNAQILESLKEQFEVAALHFILFEDLHKWDDERKCEYLRGVADGIASIIKTMGVTQHEIQQMWAKFQEKYDGSYHFRSGGDERLEEEGDRPVINPKK